MGLRRFAGCIFLLLGGVMAFATDIHLLPTQPTDTQIRQIFDHELGQKLLFHKPFDLPLEVERTHKAMVKQVEPWVKLGFINKEKTRFKAEKIMYGEPREVSVGGYKYSFNLENDLVSEKGVFYGRPMIQKIFEVSQVNYVSGEYFCEVYLSWQVNDMPEWVGKVNIRNRENRLLRRAQESHEKPFEKSLTLIFIGEKWQLWQGRGEKKTPQTLF